MAYLGCRIQAPLTGHFVHTLLIPAIVVRTCNMGIATDHYHRSEDRYGFGGCGCVNMSGSIHGKAVGAAPGAKEGQSR
ncbi:hypothetical protein TsFJ059_004848 [Trichoderma semiorbis]|uniref:Uncharacterized protein n=1 Tax=Trichoderma semiorbis TaxID=1491008 RepID=A0A9P8HLS4_9HYPO|nr:hypothetical protein TsFJ059_004848 [Trichoderma semiorbis]